MPEGRLQRTRDAYRTEAEEALDKQVAAEGCAIRFVQQYQPPSIEDDAAQFWAMSAGWSIHQESASR